MVISYPSRSFALPVSLLQTGLLELMKKDIAVELAETRYRRLGTPIGKFALLNLCLVAGLSLGFILLRF